jgi:2'-5' RNA ligase
MARLRTFIAVDLGKAIRDRCVALQELLARAATDVKWVEPENLHVSLLFLGEVEDRDMAVVCRAVADVCAAHAPFAMHVETAGCFPHPRRPRVLWVGVGEGRTEVVALHDALEKPLLQLGCYRREERRYTPHITLGRVRGDRATSALAAALAQQARWQGGVTQVQEVRVLSSELTPQGPIYTVLSRAPVRGQESGIRSQGSGVSRKRLILTPDP